MFACMNLASRDSATATSARLRRALVVDDHPIVADALVTTIHSMKVFDRIEVAASLSEARSLLEADPRCEIAVLDLHLRDADGREALVGLREAFPEIPILVFTGDNSIDNVTMAFECGARGFATKASPVGVVKGAISLILSGGCYIPPEASQALGFARPASVLSPQTQPAIRLSVRQEQVFTLLLQGMPNKVIAARLEMAEGTAKAHLNAVFRILGVRTRVEAILRAHQLGLR
jgi:DNA-binding NarL/FixJ family response regulator